MSARIYSRTLVNTIKTCLERLEIIEITGARQTGKNFLARRIVPHITEKPLRYMNFEDFAQRELFNKDPGGFIESI